MLKVTIPDACAQEAQYTLKVLLGEFLGVEYGVRIHSDQTICIEAEGARIETPSTFFALAEKKWLKPDSLPAQPLKWWNTMELGMTINLIDTNVPVIYGLPVCSIQANRISLGLDIFGSIFFMLSRYEEAVRSERDEHDRFPSFASIARQEKFLNRPIVNEYLEILWACLQYLWPILERKKRTFQVFVSVDVDLPYSYGAKGISQLLRQIGGDIVNRHSLSFARQNIMNYWKVRKGDYSSDPYLANINWMMDINEAAGNSVAFYFIADQSNHKFDGYYSISEPIIRALIKHIYERGHELGLHASYDSYRDEAQICKEADIIRKVMEEEGVLQDEIGCRQHFLRWETPTTARNLESASLTYDATLSFVDSAGFRCGTCYEYPFYDVEKRRMLNLRERPLIVMEKSVLDRANMAKTAGKDGQAVLASLKTSCRQFAGDFSILWHNNEFPTEYYREIYQEIIR